jgi:hypothetical protein
MEKGEGMKIAEKFEVKKYPSLLFLNPEGELVHRFTGFSETDEFLKKTKVVEGYIVKYLKTKYEGGNRSIDFLSRYFGVLQNAGEKPAGIKEYQNILKKKANEAIQSNGFYSLIYYMEKYLDVTKIETAGEFINEQSWFIYENSDNKEIINSSRKMMRKLVQEYNNYSYSTTYAALSYKAGDKKLGELWARKAIEQAKVNRVKPSSAKRLLKLYK